MSLAERESEAFLLGIWKNFDELEDSLNLEELAMILNSKRKEEANRQRFAAALKGINLDSESSDTEQKLEDVKRRAAMRIAGADDDEYTAMELQEVGISFMEG